MTMQTQIIPVNLSEFAFELPIVEPVHADPRDYGFDIDEEELGRELLAALPSTLVDRSTPDVDVEEFETRHSWFLS